jgi:hypothetical protein
LSAQDCCQHCFDFGLSRNGRCGLKNKTMLQDKGISTFIERPFGLYCNVVCPTQGTVADFVVLSYVTFVRAWKASVIFRSRRRLISMPKESLSDRRPEGSSMVGGSSETIARKCGPASSRGTSCRAPPNDKARHHENLAPAKHTCACFFQRGLGQGVENAPH